MHGTLTLRNFKNKSIKMRVVRNILGTATAADSEGVLMQSDALHARSDSPSAVPWYSWFGSYLGSMNPVSKMSWSADIPAGETAMFGYDWYYYVRM